MGALPEQSVIIGFDYESDDLDDMHALEQDLREAVESAGVGMWDGHEIALNDTDGRYFFYGDDADALFAVLRPILLRTDKVKVESALLSFGVSGASRMPAQFIDLTVGRND